MKFARYLQDAQTPEWKKAYIDYRGLKVQLGIIRAQSLQPSISTRAVNFDRPRDISPDNGETCHKPEEGHPAEGSAASTRIGNVRVSVVDSVINRPTNSSSHVTAAPVRRRASNQRKPSLTLAMVGLPPRITVTSSTAPSQQTPLPPRTPRSSLAFPFFRESAGTPTPLPLHIILSYLPATHIKFFDMLDAELEKVETFYAEREKEMQERAERLREQLNELKLHRQMIYRSSSRAKKKNWAKKAHISVTAAFLSVGSLLYDPDVKPEKDRQIGAAGIVASESGRGERSGALDASRTQTFPNEIPRPDDDHTEKNEHENLQRGSSKKRKPFESEALKDSTKLPVRSNSLSAGGQKDHPLEYQHAKRRLRKAIIEHYRGLEVLNNYRILNLTGFRKALKKYEKITKNSVLDAYMKEKVEPSIFASGAEVSNMLKEMEELFTTRFERGDRKRAIDRLRAGPFSKTHHSSTFRSGLWLGLALPAVAAGSYLSLQETVRESFPSWNILLFIYSVFLLPVLLALLIGVNISVWAREKINYVFIFDLNPRSRLDRHEYFELPSFLLCTLAFAFWISMAQIGPPVLWPLVWLALVLAIMSNPLRQFMWGRARWWIIKNTAKLGASGVWKVEFADFWLGDQYCSLSYSFSNLFFVGCFYARYFPQFSLTASSSPIVVDASSSYTSSFDNDTISYRSNSYAVTGASSSAIWLAYDSQAQEAWSTCGAAQNWAGYFFLGSLPLFVRFVQSVRRYWDSKLPTHLINAGKYGMGIIYSFFYYYWRHQEAPRTGSSYILWCFTASAYAIYACAWDVLMDWSLCKPHAKYPLLRSELIFKTQISSYYFALISNLLLRLLWLAYIPTGGINLTTRGFILAVLEMVRRVQWNFYRLENEHLGNIDQYRVTREVPLPYSLEMHMNEEEERDHEADADADDVEEEMEQEQDEGVAGAGESTSAWWRKWMMRSRRNGGHG